jgi:hypothetical protein
MAGFRIRVNQRPGRPGTNPLLERSGENQHFQQIVNRCPVMASSVNEYKAKALECLRKVHTTHGDTCQTSTWLRCARTSGISLSYNISVPTFGGDAPLYITSLIALTGSNQVPSFYLIVTALMSLGALIIVRKRLVLPSALIRVMIHSPDREDLVLQSPTQTGARSLRRGTGVARNREHRFELSSAGNWRWLITIGHSVVGSIESEINSGRGSLFDKGHQAA